MLNVPAGAIVFFGVGFFGIFVSFDPFGLSDIGLGRESAFIVSRGFVDDRLAVGLIPCDSGQTVAHEERIDQFLSNSQTALSTGSAGNRVLRVKVVTYIGTGEQNFLVTLIEFFVTHIGIGREGVDRTISVILFVQGITVAFGLGQKIFASVYRTFPFLGVVGRVEDCFTFIVRISGIIGVIVPVYQRTCSEKSIRARIAKPSPRLLVRIYVLRYKRVVTVPIRL